MRITGYHKVLSMLLLIAGVWALSGCNLLGKKNKPKGKPYQVLLIGDINNIVYKALNKPTPGLPQQEPLVDVVKNKTAPTDLSMYRTIIKVKHDETIRKNGGVTMSASDTKDTTKPYIINIAVANKDGLIRQLPSIQHLVVKFEIIREQKRLIKEHNPKAEQLIQKVFHRRMLIPRDLTFNKEGRDFVWLSNNTPEGMINICLYRANPNDFLSERDSVFRKNISGEHAGMYMTTDTILSHTNSKTGSTTIRGLWKMKGDAMAGPFVAYIPAHHSKEKKVLIAEAFIFAPERSKRNLIRNAEASLYTLNIKYNNS